MEARQMCIRDRARAEQSQKEWERKIAELKRKRGIIEAGEDMEEG